MQQIIYENRNRNGNGASEINGRGVRRRKLTHKQRVSLATDVALGLVRVAPSIKGTATTIGVRPDEIRAEMKVRTEAAQAVAKTTTKAAAVTTNAAVEITDSVTATMPDTPEVRVFLRRFAASLGCKIGLLDRANTGSFGATCGECVFLGYF